MSPISKDLGYEWIPVNGMAVEVRCHDDGRHEMPGMHAVTLPHLRRLIYLGDFPSPQPRRIYACGMVVCVN